MAVSRVNWMVVALLCLGLVFGGTMAMAQAPADDAAAPKAEKPAKVEKEKPAAKAEAKPAPKETPMDPDVAKAFEKFRNGDIETAILQLKETGRKNPEQSPPHIILARWFAAAQRPNEARVMLERAVIENPDNPEVYLVLAEPALNERRATEAEFLLNKANDLLAQYKGTEKAKESLTRQTLAGLATVCEARGKWAEAQKRLEAWLAADANNAACLVRLAGALLQQDKMEEAQKKLAEAFKLDPERVNPPEVELARFYANLAREAENEPAGKADKVAENRKKANEAMKSALTKWPKDVRTQMAAAELALDEGKKDSAKKLADEALNINPDSLQANFVRGVVALAMKDWATAQDHFEKVLLVNPANFPASNNLALALCEQDTAKKQRALGYAEVNARQYPRQPEVYSTLGWVLFKNARLQEADQAFQRALSAGVANPETVYYYANVLKELGRLDDARKLLDGALKAKGNFLQKADAEALLRSLQ